MTPLQFNIKLDKHFKHECMWQCEYDGFTYTVSVYKISRTMKSEKKIAFGIGTSQAKAFEDCIEFLKEQVRKR
jgi:hypothetical protein